VLFLAVPFEVVGLHRRFCGVEPNAIGFFVNLPSGTKRMFVADGSCRAYFPVGGARRSRARLFR